MEWYGGQAQVDAGLLPDRACGIGGAWTRWRSATCWPATPRASSRMRPTSAPTSGSVPAEILKYVVQRWSMEVTFEEARAHLGLETQRQWSDLAIARTTPVLLGLFSVVTLAALRCHEAGLLSAEQTAWYAKEEPTFSDCLRLVRGRIWQARISDTSEGAADVIELPRASFEAVIQGLSTAA